MSAQLFVFEVSGLRGGSTPSALTNCLGSASADSGSLIDCITNPMVRESGSNL